MKNKNYRHTNERIEKILLIDIYNARKTIHFPKYLLLACVGSDTGGGGEH